MPRPAAGLSLQPDARSRYASSPPFLRDLALVHLVHRHHRLRRQGSCSPPHVASRRMDELVVDPGVGLP
jgi:hypothetical protein